jgi:aldose 1-epimerase
VITLAAGGATVQIYPDHGGRVGQISADGTPLLRGAENARPGWSDWGAYVLLPWSNRIPAGTFTFEGRTLHVPVNWPDGTALHGLVAWRRWDVVSVSADAAELTVDVHEDAYTVRGRQATSLTASALELLVEVTNRGPERVPVGLGLHPWFRAGPVRVPADLIWPGDGPMPAGAPRPVTPDEDLRSLRVPPSMDRCYTGLSGNHADVPGARLRWSDAVTQVVVFSGDPAWVCVEPVTMASDGFRLAEQGMPGTGVAALDPDETFAVTYTFEW